MTAANLVTLSRVAITPVVLVNVVWGRHRQAAIWFAIAAFTDFLDGRLARGQGAVTTAGQYLDPIADKILLNGAFVALAIEGSIPAWFVVLVLGRDLAILTASAIAMRFSSYRDYTPTVWGKISTVLQILAATAVMVSNAEGSDRMAPFARAAVWASAGATLWSTIHYTWRGVNYFVGRIVR